MRNAFMESLLLLAQSDQSVMLLVGDLGYGVVEHFASTLPSQYLNVGVAEQNMLGVAAGLASAGHKVFVYSIANFPSLRALEQIRNDVCYHALDVTVVSVGAGMAYGPLGYSHHAIEDVSAIRALPNMTVVSPADAGEARAALREASLRGGPRYIRLGKNGERDLHPAEPSSLHSPIEMRHGSDVTLLGTGPIVAECIAASDILSEAGISAAVVSCPTVTPLDAEWFSTLPEGTPILTVEEHVLAGGFGSAVLELVNDLELPLRVGRRGLRFPERLPVGSHQYLRSQAGLTAFGIAHGARALVGAEDGAE